MGKTIAEKLLSRAAGKELAAGEFALVKVDLCLLQDGTGPLAIRQYEKMGLAGVANPEGTVLFLDHAAPSPRKELSNDHILMRRFAEETGAVLSEVGDGVCHQVMSECYTRPWAVLVGADSHTCTGGALGAFATGMGSTDVAVAMGLGQTWMRVPETIRVEARGELRPWVTSKDVILHVIGRLGADGATYMALEYGGDAVRAMTLESRLVLSNMAVEAGAKAGLCAADAVTRGYLARHGREADFSEIAPDPDAAYADTLKVDCSALEPTVSKPHAVDNTATVDEVAGTKVDQVFLGSCTNGRLEDLELAARILRGRRRHPRTRLVVVPASRRVYLEAMASGALPALVEAGAAVVTPGCAACVGVHSGILGDGEVCVATTNRNFVGRMGNPEGLVYLASPAVAAAAAVAGEIVHPKEFLGA